jgi:hypothetical protein
LISLLLVSGAARLIEQKNKKGINMNFFISSPQLTDFRLGRLICSHLGLLNIRQQVVLMCAKVPRRTVVNVIPVI